MVRRRAVLIIALALAGCGGPAKGPAAPAGEAGLALTVEDVIVPGEAMIIRTSMATLQDSRLTSVLLGGLERQATGSVPALGRALEAAERAPIEDATDIIVTGRSLDESSALLVVAVAYEKDVDWFEDFVLDFHAKKYEAGTLAALEEGAMLGVLARDTTLSWGTDLRASVCAVRFTPRLVAYLAAPDPGECRVWASWIIARKGGDSKLIGKLSRAPEIGGKPPPLAVYVDGAEFEKLCCTPWNLTTILAGVAEAWIGLDPDAPATLRIVAAYDRPERALMKRDALAKMLDVYAPTVRLFVPGLGSSLDAMELEVEGSLLILGLTVDALTVESVADLLSTML
ncbi:MAG: hypothetical protein JRG91_14370 [Deltaproteobacteria bacterium]|nr:hypothetical protein [Deltaproteobacteria bacterium]